MSDQRRSSDIKEDLSARALLSLIVGVIVLTLGIVMIIYRGMLIGLAYVLTLAGIAAVGYGIYALVTARKVGGVSTKCPYCGHSNEFTEAPMRDFACRSCARMVPLDNGQILEVHQVRCGYCNTLNYWSARSFGLICEECSHEIPIAGLTGGKHRIEQFAVTDDDKYYDLVLTSVQRNSEDLIGCLQSMLALNRNQVKDMLGELPQVLLQGVPKKKAELLSAQLSQYQAKAEIREHTPNV